MWKRNRSAVEPQLTEVPSSTSEPKLPKPPHKYPWEDFAVECEVGKLVCSFIPGGSHPEGFTGPFQDRFAEYLGLTASVSYHVERQNQEQGTGWLLRYRIREGDQWTEKTEVLEDCGTEDEAAETAWRRMDDMNGAKTAGVHALAGPASQEFLGRLEEVLGRALAHLFDYSCNYTKLIHTDSPTAKNLAAERKQISMRQKEEAILDLREQVRKGIDRENALRALAYIESQEPYEWTPTTAIKVEGSLVKFPRVKASELGNTRLEGEPELIVSRGGDQRDYQTKELWANNDIYNKYVQLVTRLTPGWKWLKESHDDQRLTPDEWIEEIRHPIRASQLATYFEGCKKLSNELLLRVTDTGIRARDREPVSLACFHAAYEVEILIDGKTLSIMDVYQTYEGMLPAPATLRRHYDNYTSSAPRS